MKILNTNSPINIVGRDLGAISANKVESLIDFTTPEAQSLFETAKKNNMYINFISDETKIKTLVLMDSGTLYPSTFNLGTLAKRIYEATNIPELGKENMEKEQKPS